MNEEQIRQLIAEELAKFIRNDRWIFDKNIQILDARHIQVGRTNGLKIGTEGYVSASNQGQKIGFYGVTPVVQHAAISSPGSGGVAGVDQGSRDAIGEIKDALTKVGITL